VRAVVRRRRKFDVRQENTERWLLTYADLITLLLALFIVMYSMSRVDARKFGRVTEALSGILRGDSPMLAAVGGDGLTGPMHPALGRLFALRESIEERVSKQGLSDRIETLQDDRGLVIRIMESAAFDPGSAELKPQMFPVLEALANELSGLPNQVRIEGHTDNTPIATSRYPSNWELSTARSTGVVRYLVEQLHVDPRRVSALGYAEYRPIADNETALGRARNRRVDIIVLLDSGGEPRSPLVPVEPRSAHRDTLMNS
jgi:chemotaxis protein MotB